MKRLRIVIALGSSLVVGACQTVASAGSGLTLVNQASSTVAASARATAPSNEAARAGIARPAARSDVDAPASNFARASSRNILLLVAVVAVVVIGVALLSGDGGEGIY
jgi:hypothetical protein